MHWFRKLNRTGLVFVGIYVFAAIFLYVYQQVLYASEAQYVPLLERGLIGWWLLGLHWIVDLLAELYITLLVTPIYLLFNGELSAGADTFWVMFLIIFQGLVYVLSALTYYFVGVILSKVYKRIFPSAVSATSPEQYG